MRDRKNDTLHRRVLETKLGRRLHPSEVADHVDEDKSNQRPDNLRAMPRGAHTAHHNRNRAVSKIRAALRMVKEGKKAY